MSRIGLIGSNSVEFIEILLNIWNNNDSATLIDCDTPAKAAADMLSEVGADFCYVEDTIKDKYGVISSFLTLTGYSVHNKMPCVLPNDVRDLYKPRYDESEAIVIYSSGTAGKHKGVSLSHRAINNNADPINDYMKPSESDSLYLNKKLTHCSSLVGELLVSLKTGAYILLAPVVIPPRIAFNYITEFKVTILCCNPYLLNLYSDEAKRTGHFPDSITKIYTSGDIVSEKTIEKARKLFNRPVYNAYGQTECGPRISVQTEEYSHGNSVGKPIKNVDVKIDQSGEVKR